MLDEIGDVPGSIQVKLFAGSTGARVRRAGYSNKTQHTDVRVIAATNVDLREALEQGTFREDLYYRLNVVPLNIPPLRERKEDIPYLVEHLRREVRRRDRQRRRTAMELAGRVITGRGNVRELENVVERSILLQRADREVEADDVRIETSNCASALQHGSGGSLPLPKKE